MPQIQITSVLDNGDRTYSVLFSGAVTWDNSSDPDTQWILMDPTNGPGTADAVSIVAQTGAEVVKVQGYYNTNYNDGPMILFGQPAHLTAGELFQVAEPVQVVT